MSRSKKAVKEPLSTRESLSGTIKTIRNIMRKDKGLNGDLDRLPMLTWLMFLKFLDDSDELHRVSDELAGRPHVPLIEEPYRWRDWAGIPEGLTGPELIAFINQDEAIRPDGTRGPGLFAYLKTRSGGRGDVVANVFRELQNRMSSGYLLRDVVNKISEVSFGSSESIHTLSHLYESMLKEMRDAAGDSGEFYTPRPVVKFMIQVLDPKLGEKVLDPACGTGGFLVEAYEHMKEQAIRAEHFRVLQEESLFGNEAKSLPYLLAQMNLVLHGVESPNITVGNSLAVKLTEIGDAERVDVIATNPPFGGEEERSIQDGFPEDKRTGDTAILFLQLIMRRLKKLEKPGRAAVIVPNTTLFYPGVPAKIREELLKEFNLHTIVRLPKGVFLPYTDIETNILFFDRAGSTTEVIFYKLLPPNERQQYSKTLPLGIDDLSECRQVILSRTVFGSNAWSVSASEILSDPRVNLDLHNPNTAHIDHDSPSEVSASFIAELDQVRDRMKLLTSVLDRFTSETKYKEGWVELQIGKALKRRKDAVLIEDTEVYKRITIQVKGRGVRLRDQVKGVTIGTKRQFRISTGQFVLSKIDARYGAFGIVPIEADNAVITGNFWAYDVDDSKINPRLLHFLTRSDAFMQFCAASSPGATNRRYLQEDLFLSQTLKLPSTIEDQAILCDILEEIELISVQQERELALLLKRSPTLLQSSLSSVFGDTAAHLE